MRLIGDILVSGRALTNDQLEKALEHKSRVKGHLGTAILEITNVSEQLVLRALSLQHKVPPAGTQELDDVRPDILRLIPMKLATRHMVIPFRRLGRVLSVAMVNPADLPAIDEISFLTGLQIAPHVALEFRIAIALGRYYGAEVSPRFPALAERLDKNKAGVGGRAATATRAFGPTASGVDTPPSASGPYEPGGPPPPPRFYRTGGERPDTAPPTESGDPWSAVEVPVPADAPMVTETFAKSAPRAPKELDDTDLKRLRGPDAPPPAQASAPIIHEPSPLPRPALRPVVPTPAPPPAPPPPARASRPSTPSGSVSRFSANVSGSWLDQDETPTPSNAPDVLASTTPVPPPAPAAPAPRPRPASSPAAAVPARREEADLVSRLASAESRDEIADAVLAATVGLVKRAALFIAQPDAVLGWAARPEPPEELRAFSIPYSEPSLFASLRNTEGFYAGPIPDMPGNRRILDAIGSSGIPVAALVPITLKGKSVLFLFGEAESSGAPPPVPALKRLASMTAIALEIVLLKNKLRNL